MTIPARIPVVMYHSVGRNLPGWIWSDLTTDVDLFARQVELLDRQGYRSITLDDYRERQDAGRVGPRREVVLTFDDGYLDNWVFVYPILKRMGWRGTIYVNPEFIDPGEEPRPNLEDVWEGRCRREDLRVHGFLNRGEIRALHRSGVMGIASHSMSHTWYPTGPDVEDFHRPDRATPWLAWNARPDRKHAYLTEDQSSFVPWGHPILASGRSLGIRRYLPDPAAAAAAEQWVADHGGPAAFSRPDWRPELLAAVSAAPDGRCETDAEMETRFRYEIHGAQDALAELVGEPIRHFCWPGGASCEESWKVADGIGFDTICVARHDKRRWHAEDPSYVRRISCSDHVSFRGRRYATGNPHFLLWFCEIELGHAWKRWPLRLNKALLALGWGRN